MPDLKEITCLSVDYEFHTCPACGYKLGFHTSFVSTGTNSDNPGEVWRVILICPECGTRYDVGWRVSFQESGSRSMKDSVRAPARLPHGNPADCLPARTRHHEHTTE